MHDDNMNAPTVIESRCGCVTLRHAFPDMYQRVLSCPAHLPVVGMRRDEVWTRVWLFVNLCVVAGYLCATSSGAIDLY